MQQSITYPSVPREVVATITRKGQVTIPADVRRHLGVQPREKVAFVVDRVGTVQVKPAPYPTVASLRGAAGTLKQPLSWRQMRQIAREDRAEARATKRL